MTITKTEITVHVLGIEKPFVFPSANAFNRQCEITIDPEHVLRIQVDDETEIETTAYTIISKNTEHQL